MGKAILVNLYGVPGAGKSSGAAYIFSKLKFAGVNCELVSEFAKQVVWAENERLLENQVYIFAKQYNSLWRLQDKVDVIVTDSPLWLSGFYNKRVSIQKPLENMVRVFESDFHNMNYFLTRVKPYNPSGRLQSEEESNRMADSLYRFLGSKITAEDGLFEVAGDEDGYRLIFGQVLATLAELKGE